MLRLPGIKIGLIGPLGPIGLINNHYHLWENHEVLSKKSQSVTALKLPDTFILHPGFTCNSGDCAAKSEAGSYAKGPAIPIE
jgi:hypothetical protein